MCLGQRKIPAALANERIFDLRSPTEYIYFTAGLGIVIAFAPPLVLCLATATLWEAVDRGFDGGFFQSGKERTGFILGRFAPWLSKVTQKTFEKYSRRKENAFILLAVWAYGVGIPLAFLYTGYVVATSGWVKGLVAMFIYNVIRTGPFFMNFAYVYTLSHKEAHTRVGLYKAPYQGCWSGGVFNWWIGLFYGITPGAFTYGHVQNHHLYNNEELDAHTTGDKPRDSIVNFIAYLPRWFLYASNLSTMYIIAFKDKKTKVALKMVRSTLYYVACIAACWMIGGPSFTTGCVIYPFFESLVLLAAVNWVWHGFMDPVDPLNEYILSPTFIDGSVNVLNEDMHVVHHQFPGAAWIDHPIYVLRNVKGYQDNKATVFHHTHVFEVFAMMVLRDYDNLAKHFVDLDVISSDELKVFINGRAFVGDNEKDKALLASAEKKIDQARNDPKQFKKRRAVVKERLRTCNWGMRAVKSC